MIIIFNNKSKIQEYIGIGIVITAFIAFTIYFAISSKGNKTDISRNTNTITNNSFVDTKIVSEETTVTTSIVSNTEMSSLSTSFTTTTEPITTTTEPLTTTNETVTTTTPSITTTTPSITTTKKPEKISKASTTQTQPVTTSTTTSKNTMTTTRPYITETATISENYILPYALTDNDWFMICKVVCSETGYCGDKQQKAVAYTIFNRIIHANTHTNSPYPKDVYGILHQPAQYDAINYWRADTRLQPGGSLWNNTMRIIKEAVYEPDFTNGAIGYYDPTVCGYLSVFEYNPAIYCCYTDGNARFFSLTQK